MKKAGLRNFILHVSIRCFDINLPQIVISNDRICESGSLNFMRAGGNDAKLKPRLSKSSPFEVKMLVEFIRRGISDIFLCFIIRNQDSSTKKLNDKSSNNCGY
jgi:hypothetical protein